MSKQRVFLSAPFEARIELRVIRDELEAAGLKVVSRWIDTPDYVSDDGSGDVVGWLALREEAIERNLEDIDACDVFVAFAWEGGRGARHVELGIAMERERCTGSPQLLLVGCPEHLMHLHPHVARYPSLSGENLALAIRTAHVWTCGHANGLHPACEPLLPTLHSFSF